MWRVAEALRLRYLSYIKMKEKILSLWGLYKSLKDITEK
jgi:hypothetical protein